MKFALVNDCSEVDAKVRNWGEYPRDSQCGGRAANPSIERQGEAINFAWSHLECRVCCGN